ncbi:SCP2 sterol-binding domain-containing protein [Micromonospora sp. NBC_01392]|uniref:SCP2 sterol-binding domain-containing protein n=1 Tax=Micromonospora sp. NBC_01392 TaxID=2903588 RepID=UPI0032484942
MTDVTGDFFASLPRRAATLWLAPVEGTVRFDLTSDGQVDHWYVTFARDHVAVTAENKPADLVWESSRSSFRRIVSGASPAAAILRNEVQIQGSLDLFVHLGALFPSAPGSRDPREFAQNSRSRGQEGAEE